MFATLKELDCTSFCFASNIIGLQIFTSILFPSFSEEHSGRFAEVWESDVENSLRGKKVQTLEKDLLQLNSQNVSVRRAQRNQRNREDSSD